MRSRDDLACDLAFDLASDLAFHDLAFDLAASSRSRRDLATREQVHGKRVVQMTEAQRQALAELLEAAEEDPQPQARRSGPPRPPPLSPHLHLHLPRPPLTLVPTSHDLPRPPTISAAGESQL